MIVDRLCSEEAQGSRIFLSASVWQFVYLFNNLKRSHKKKAKAMSAISEMRSVVEGEARFNVFSLTSSLFHLAYRSYYGLHCEMMFACVLGD